MGALAVGRVAEADDASEILNRRDRFQRAGDHLAGPGALGVFGQTSFEQLGVREYHTELVVQPVKDLRQRSGIERRWRCRRWVRRHD